MLSSFDDRFASAFCGRLVDATLLDDDENKEDFEQKVKFRRDTKKIMVNA